MIKTAWSKLASKLLSKVTEANQRQWTILYTLAMLLVSVWLVMQLVWLKQANQRFAEATSQRLSLVQVVVDYLSGRQSLDRLNNRQALSQAWPSASERQAQVERLINERKLSVKINPTVATGSTTEATMQLSGSQSELWQLIAAMTTQGELPGILSFELLAGPVPNQEQLTLQWRLGQTKPAKEDKNEKL